MVSRWAMKQISEECVRQTPLEGVYSFAVLGRREHIALAHM